jgi:hypothetical protein
MTLLSLPFIVLLTAGELTAKERSNRSPASIAPKPLQYDAHWATAQALRKPEILLSPRERENQLWESRGVLVPNSLHGPSRSPASAASRASAVDGAWNSAADR